MPLNKYPPDQQTTVENVTIVSLENRTTENEINNHKNISKQGHNTVLVPKKTSPTTNIRRNITTTPKSEAAVEEEKIITKHESQTPVVPQTKALQFKQTKVNNRTIVLFENKTENQIPTQKKHFRCDTQN